MHGECSLQSLTQEELSFAKELMVGGFTFLSAKKALEKRKGDSEKKRKRHLLDTSHVDRVTTGQSTPSGLAEPSLRKASTKKSKVVEEDDVVTLTLPANASTYSNTSFSDTVVDSLLFPVDQKRLSDIGTIQAANRSITCQYQVSCSSLVWFNT